MDLSYLGIALITFILAITLYQTNGLIEDYLQSKSSISITFSHPFYSTNRYSANYNYKGEYSLKTNIHMKEYPCE